MFFDAGVMNSFLDGTINVLPTMCQTTPKPGKPGLKGKVLTGDISGAISLSSPGQHGVFILSFSKRAALLIVSRLLSEQKAEIDGEAKDAVGEMTNMIAGNSRKNLEALGNKYEAGTPTVVVGMNHEIHTKVSDRAPVISIPFVVNGGFSFTAELTFERAGT